MSREYYKIKIPNPQSQIQHTIDVSIGVDDTQRYSLDGKYVIIKTTPSIINIKINTGVSRDTIFPPGLTTQLTYEEARILMTTEDWQTDLKVYKKINNGKE